MPQVHLLDAATARAFEAIVDLPSNLATGKQVDTPFVSDWVALEGAVQPSLQVEELLWSEEICRKDPRIAEAARAVGVEPENLYVDGKLLGGLAWVSVPDSVSLQDGVSALMNVSRIVDCSNASSLPG